MDGCVCVWACVRVCVCTGMCEGVDGCVRVWACVRVCGWVCACMGMCEGVWMGVCVCACMCEGVWMGVCVCACMCEGEKENFVVHRIPQFLFFAYFVIITALHRAGGLHMPQKPELAHAIYTSTHRSSRYTLSQCREKDRACGSQGHVGNHLH